MAAAIVGPVAGLLEGVVRGRSAGRVIHDHCKRLTLQVALRVVAVALDIDITPQTLRTDP